MLSYIVRRLLLMIPTLFAISVVTFIIIQLPPGDFLDSLVAGMNAQGEEINQEAVQALRDRYGLGQPLYIQYFKWIGGVLQGDFGQSFLWNRPVKDLIWDRIGLTVLLSLGALLLIWAIALPVGIYSAVRRYTMGDYLVSFLAFVGVAIPEFLIALVLMFVAFKYFGLSVGGLFSAEFVNAPWSLARVGDLLSHLWIPVLIIALGSTGDLIRIMRANLLDELAKPYVVTARAKGLSETHLLLKYPVRLALNPFVSTIGYVLPGLVSGATIVSVVLSLPTTGPLQLEALQTQDMYLAGSIILMISVLTVIGTLISDLLLAWLDPRIRLQ
jgi:peptide/nickel transport system permease protein